MDPRGPGELGARRHLVTSQRLRQRRRELGLTQRDVTTRLAALGVRSTHKALSSLEHGSGLDVAKLPELASALDCSVTWLLGLTEDPHSWEPADHLSPRPRDPLAAPEPAAAAQPVATPDAAVAGTATAAHRPWILGPLEAAPLPDTQPHTASPTR